MALWRLTLCASGCRALISNCGSKELAHRMSQSLWAIERLADAAGRVVTAEPSPPEGWMIHRRVLVTRTFGLLRRGCDSTWRGKHVGPLTDAKNRVEKQCKEKGKCCERGVCC